MFAMTRGFGGVVLRLLAAGAGIDIEGASPVGAVFHGASESTGPLGRENRRWIEKTHQVPDLSLDATRRFRSAAIRSGQGRRGRCDLDGCGVLRGALPAGGGIRAAV